jgi:hypothetical protein
VDMVGLRRLAEEYHGDGKVCGKDGDLRA